MYISAAFVAAAMSLASSANAHVVMRSPTPYSGKSLVQVNPLDGATYQFPCQGGTDASYYEGSEVTDMTAGGTTNVSFTGSAVHGGGSCQLSITYENPPPADRNKWKVIHSIEGGCPATYNDNLTPQGQDKQGRVDGPHCTSPGQTGCLKEYEIAIPKELKSGKATFAWTWLNNMGNREFYMNCAPINIQGGSDSDTYFNSLPSLFVANFGDECKTTGEGVVPYPNPGTSVEKDGTANSAILGSCASETGGAGSPAAATSAGSGSQQSSAPAASAPATSAASQPTSAASNTGGVFAPGASSATYTATSMATVVVSTSAPAATGSSSSGGSSSGSSSSGSSSGVDCSEDGALVCIGTTQFGICNRGKAIPQDVAAGTTCTNGKIVTANSKREAKQSLRAALSATQNE